MIMDRSEMTSPPPLPPASATARIASALPITPPPLPVEKPSAMATASLTKRYGSLIALDALTLHGIEADQRKADRVGARAEVDDLVLPLRVGDCGSHLLDQGRTGGFDGDPRHHGTGAVFDNAGDRTLCACDARDEQ